jgi:hypothetical protein
MIFHLHGEALIGGIERWSFGDSPGLKNALHLEAEIVVQACGVVLLDDEAVSRFGFDFAGRFGRFVEAAFSFVFF